LLFITLLSGLNATDYNTFDAPWCGNSKVNVEITTTEAGKMIVTKASIIVPSSITRVRTRAMNQKVADLKLIPKTEQGIIMTLDGKAQKEHLGNIYNYDEDDNTQIFIPYLYLSAIEENFDRFNVHMSRTFKGEKELKFDLVPVADAYGVNLCDCQRKMFADRIKANLLKRYSILTELAQNLSTHISSVIAFSAQIKALENTKIDKSKVQALTKAIPVKDSQCTTLKNTINDLNNKQDSDKTKKDELDNQAYQLTISIQDTENYLEQLQQSMKTVFENASQWYEDIIANTSDIIRKMGTLQKDYSDRVNKKTINTQITELNKQQTFANSQKSSPTFEKTKVESAITYFKSIKDAYEKFLPK
jgi:hypothetical protein